MRRQVKNTAHRPSQSNQKFVKNSRGIMVRNTAYREKEHKILPHTEKHKEMPLEEKIDTYTEKALRRFNRNSSYVVLGDDLKEAELIQSYTDDFSSKYVDAEYDSGIVLKGNNGTCVIIGENDFYFDFDDLDYVSWEEQQYDMKKYFLLRIMMKKHVTVTILLFVIQKSYITS